MGFVSLVSDKDNLKALIQAASELPFADKNNITLFGFSYGGHTAALTAKELQDKIKRLIMFYPVFETNSDIAENDISADSTFDTIKAYKGPVMIIHGSNDTFAAPESSKKAYQAYLKERGNSPLKNVQLVMVDGAVHGFTGNDEKLWNKYSLFAIKKFLQGKTLFFNVDVNITHAEDEKLNDGGTRVKVYFNGHAESPYFSGDVEEPAYDEQIYHSPSPDSCCADYKVIGKDYTGKDCYVKIANRLSKAPRAKKVDWYTGWKPTVSTDSEALSLINSADCETYAEMRPKGPFIHIWA